jgi:hypothetical protein
MTDLKYLAHTYGVAIVVINEMSANFNKSGIPNGNSIICHEFHNYEEDRTWDNGNIPSLGQALSACINVRCQFERKRIGRSCRSLHLVFSPYCPKSMVEFDIDDCGLHVIKDCVL